MKNLRMVWMAVAAVLVCVNLVSCSKDDQEKEIVKKLSKFTVENSSGRVEMTFNYDLEGRLQGAEQINYDGSNVTTNVYEFTWGENTIDFVMTKVEAEDWVENTTLTLENGLAKLQSEDYLFGVESTFAYDTLGRLVKTTRAYYDLTLGWEDNKLTSIKNANFMLGYNQSFEYESVSSLKGHNPLLPYRVGAGILFVAHPELAGLLTNQFPVKETVQPNFVSGSVSTFTYESDADLYVTKIIEKGASGDSEVETFTHTMIWE